MERHAMKALFFAFIASLLWSVSLFSQETDYQRNDLKREESELALESGLKTWMEGSNTDTLYNFKLNAGIEYTLSSHSIKAVLPYTFMLYDNSEALNRFFYYIGDIHLSYEYLKQLTHLNLFFGSFLSIPLTVSNEYAARESVYALGECRYEAGLSFSMTGIRDPIVWILGLRYALGLPKEERYYTSWRPGTIQASLGISDLFNDRFGFSVGLSETLILPRMIGLSMEPDGLSMSTGFKLEAFILFEHDYLRFSTESYIFPMYQPVVIGVTYGHNFKLATK
jgi:hypothetical protein